MLIREARDHELDEVSSLMVDAYREYAHALPEGSWEAYRADIAAVRERLDRSQLLVALDGAPIAGAVTFYPPGGFAVWPPAWASFRLLAVPPACRRRGVARALADETIERARGLGAEALGIHTTPAMAAGVALYRALGFVRDERFDFEPPGITAPDGSKLRVSAYRLELARG